MHILLSNDDGVLAPSLIEFANYLAKFYKVTVVAPEVEQSAKSHALTIETPLRVQERSEKGINPTVYAVTGTPTDCAKLALSYLLKEDKPDLVISGINNGFNLGSDALYSGTIGAGMEAIFYQVPSLAISVEKYSSQRGEEMFPLIREVIERIFVTGEFKGFLNMNFPLVGECVWDKLKVVRQGVQEYTDIIDVRTDRRGRQYFWIGGTLQFPKMDYPTDVAEIKKGYITLVPLSWQQEDLNGVKALHKMI